MNSGTDLLSKILIFGMMILGLYMVIISFTNNKILFKANRHEEVIDKCMYLKLNKILYRIMGIICLIIGLAGLVNSYSFSKTLAYSFFPLLIVQLAFNSKIKKYIRNKN